MKEWKNGSMEDSKKSLIDFVRRIKSSDFKKKKILEELEYTIHLFYSVSGPVYDRVGSSTNVRPDRIMLLLDKRDRLERALKKIEEEKNIFKSFVNSLTERQKEVFDWYFMKNEKISRVAKYLNLSSSAVNQKIEKIFNKWRFFK